jgi:hypothetical protein
MKIIIENHSDLPDSFVLNCIIGIEFKQAVEQMPKHKYYNNEYKITDNGVEKKYSLWVNKIKTGLTFKFYEKDK